MDMDMEKYVHRENLALFKKRLADAHGDAEREVLSKLLADEEAKEPPPKNRCAGTSEQTKQIREGTMATQIIMDHNGDTRHNFDAKDAKALLKAERRFKALTGAGFTAATRTASGEPVVTRTFDPTAEETLFFARLVGG